jgi:hypothetical protein
MLHSSAILPPHYAVDGDGHVGHLPPCRRNAHKLPSIVGGVHGEAAHHLVARGYLILDEYPDVRNSGCELGKRPSGAFAAGLLVGKQFGVADVVGGHHLIQRL